ncbi:spondin domain-containing protein [Paraglaciecola sp. L3A3]|uniref:spondin domain-containing protein n=1 Tax=Paraglaciecola sp. L3A3 TaxID=2686358 RepID=UPI00131E4B58|nr:spondin domain-containing protein [Paraglaciecola sp. L3A3]
MIKIKPTYLAALLAVSSAGLNAAELNVEIQNLTHGLYFTPIAVVAHTPESSLFEVGEVASTELQMMAEGGSLDGISTIATSVSADVLANPAAGLLAPSAKASGTLSTAADNTVLSVVAMALPTNDGFIGLDNWPIPTEAGTYTIYLNAYDAGTEANDELRGGGAPGVPGMPVPPPLEGLVGTNGSGVAGADTNTSVHIHRGNIGDESMTEGSSDVSNTVHRWLNPVAKVTVTVN